MRVRPLQASKKNFCVQTGICKNDRLQFVLQKLLCNSRRFVDVIAANAQRSINRRRIVEDKSFRCGRRAVGMEDCNLGFEEAQREFCGSADGCATDTEYTHTSATTRT